jgi:PKD repeat protein
MSFIINKTDGSLLVEIFTGENNTNATSLTLIGEDAKSYGKEVNENFVRLLENFAKRESPVNAISGQLWFDLRSKRLKVYNGLEFVNMAGAIVSPTRPPSLVPGDLWINNVDDQLRFFDGEDLVLTGPVYTTAQGLSDFTIETIKDVDNNDHVVTKLWSAGVLVGIFSSDPEFTPLEPIENFTGTIKTGFVQSNIPGIFFNADFANTDGILDPLGNLKTAADFMLTQEDTGTVGIVTIQNAVPLVFVDSLANPSSSVRNVTVTSSTSEFTFNSRNQDISMAVNSNLGLVATSAGLGLLVETPEAGLDVGGSTRVNGNLRVSYFTNSTGAVNVSNPIIRLNSNEITGGISSSNGTAGIYSTTSTGNNAGIRWTEDNVRDFPRFDPWELSFGEVVSGVEVYAPWIYTWPSLVAKTQKFEDLIGAPTSGDGLWTRTNTTGVYRLGNASMGRNVSTEYNFDANGPAKMSLAKYEYSDTESILLLDLNESNHFVRTITRNSVFNVDNIPASGTVAAIILDVINGGRYCLEFWKNISWPFGKQPFLCEYGKDVLGFTTVDGGTTWYGMHLGSFPEDPPIPQVSIDFVGTPLLGNSPLSVQFTAYSSGIVDSWLWDFKNDGTSTSTVRNPTYEYADPGTYTVKLTALNSVGEAVATKIDYITVSSFCAPYQVDFYPWTLLPDPEIDANWDTFYNDPTHDGVTLNLNLGGYRPSWIGDGDGVYTYLGIGGQTNVYLDGGVYQSQSNELDLWRYSSAFNITDPITLARYTSVAGNSNGTVNAPPGHNQYPGVATFSNWYGAYFQAKDYGLPIVCEMWYSLNPNRTNPLRGYNNYSFFGDANTALPYVYLPAGGYVKKYYAGIFKVNADMYNPADEDCVMVASYVGNDTSGTLRIIKEGIELASKTLVGPANSVTGFLDNIFEADPAFIGTGKSRADEIDISTDLDFIFTAFDWPDGTNTATAGIYDTYQVKLGWMIENYTGAPSGTYNPNSNVYWYPGMFYTVPNAPLSCSPTDPQPSYIPPAPIEPLP